MKRDEFRVEPVHGPAITTYDKDGWPFSTWEVLGYRLYYASWQSPKEGYSIKRRDDKRACRWKRVGGLFESEAAAWNYVDSL